MKKLFLLPSLCLVFFFQNCKENDPEPANENELITKVELHFYQVGNPSNHFVKSFTDPDGDGKNGTAEQIILKKGISYTMDLMIKNESDPSKVEDLTEEIKEEGEAHQFFISTSPTSLANIVYVDMDGDGKPVGLKNIVETGSSVATGTLKIVLRHTPDKSAAGVSSGMITNAGGTTDLDINFPVSVVD